MIAVVFGKSLLEDSWPPSTLFCFIQAESSILGLIDWYLIIKQNLSGFSLEVELNLEDTFSWVVFVSEEGLELLGSIRNSSNTSLNPFIGENTNLWSNWPNALLSPEVWFAGSLLIQISWRSPSSNVLLIHSNESSIVSNSWDSKLHVPIKGGCIIREIFIVIFGSRTKEILVDGVTFLVVE